jgi:hypothetical protein
MLALGGATRQSCGRFYPVLGCSFTVDHPNFRATRGFSRLFGERGCGNDSRSLVDRELFRSNSFMEADPLATVAPTSVGACD